MLTLNTAPMMFLVILVAAVAAVAALLLVAGLTETLVRNHRSRVARHESIPVYYRRLVLAH